MKSQSDEHVRYVKSCDIGNEEGTERAWTEHKVWYPKKQEHPYSHTHKGLHEKIHAKSYIFVICRATFVTNKLQNSLH